MDKYTLEKYTLKKYTLEKLTLGYTLWENILWERKLWENTLGKYTLGNSKINGLCFFNFFIWATDTEISVKNSVWGPVEVGGDELNELEGYSQKQN